MCCRLEVVAFLTIVPALLGFPDSGGCQEIAAPAHAKATSEPLVEIGAPWCESCLDACPCVCSGCIAAVEWINWQVRQRERFQVLGGAGPVAPDIGNPLEFDRANGLRATLGFRFCSGWEAEFVYSYLRPHGNETVDGGEFGQTFVRDHDIQIDYDVFDLQIVRSISVAPDCDLSVFGGIRLARIDQQTTNQSRFFENGVATSTSSSAMLARTNAAGIRVGGAGNWRWGPALSVFVSAAGSVLVQDWERRFSFHSSDDPASDLDDHDSATDGLPVVETSAGIAWTSGRVTVKAGYELATWFNMTEIGVLPPLGLQNNTRSLTFDGVFVELAYTY